jgi:DNA-binding transcriptional regulator YiaG
MTAAELSAHLTAQQISAEYLARVLGVSGRAVRMWLAGDRAVPEPVAKLVRLVDSGAVTHAAVERA